MCPGQPGGMFACLAAERRTTGTRQAPTGEPQDGAKPTPTVPLPPHLLRWDPQIG